MASIKMRSRSISTGGLSWLKISVRCKTATHATTKIYCLTLLGGLLRFLSFLSKKKFCTKRKKDKEKKRWIKCKPCHNLITLRLPWGLGNLRAHFILKWGRIAVQVWCMITEDFKPKIGRLRSRRDILTKVLYSDKRARRWSAIFFFNRVWYGDKCFWYPWDFH